MRLVLPFFVTLAACAAANPVPDGTPIDGTSINSCGDDLRGLAEPAGGLDAQIAVTASSTNMTGEIMWEASCPLVDSSASTQFVLSHAKIYRDNAGYPGDLITETDVDFEGVASCADRFTSQIGGVDSKLDFGPTDVPSLQALCTEYKSSPPSGPLFVQVELTGPATTCSDEVHHLLFRSQVGVTCP